MRFGSGLPLEYHQMSFVYAGLLSVFTSLQQNACLGRTRIGAVRTRSLTQCSQWSQQAPLQASPTSTRPFCHLSVCSSAYPSDFAESAISYCVSPRVVDVSENRKSLRAPDRRVQYYSCLSSNTRRTAVDSQTVRRRSRIKTGAAKHRAPACDPCAQSGGFSPETLLPPQRAELWRGEDEKGGTQNEKFAALAMKETATCCFFWCALSRSCYCHLVRPYLRWMREQGRSYTQGAFLLSTSALPWTSGLHDLHETYWGVPLLLKNSILPWPSKLRA